MGKGHQYGDYLKQAMRKSCAKTRKKMRKSGFYECNAITRAEFQNGTVPRAPFSDGKTFFGLRLSLAGRCCENLQSARGHTM